jgi:hypothetical protein
MAASAPELNLAAAHSGYLKPSLYAAPDQDVCGVDR